MKITKRMLSLPPYLSTPWKNVAALHVKLAPGAPTPILVVRLVDGSSVEIPGLSQIIVDQIFAAHAEVIETGETEREVVAGGNPEQFVGLPFRIGPGGVENLGGMLAHDRSQADAPDLPPEILSKIAGVAQVLGAENADNLPDAEAGCNCFHCQIARAISGNTDQGQPEKEEEEVSDEDLRFRAWDIEQSDEGKEFYTVMNPLDKAERYTVHLGNPIGCTCGHKNCEHIKAVLKS